MVKISPALSEKGDSSNSDGEFENLFKPVEDPHKAMQNILEEIAHRWRTQSDATSSQLWGIKLDTDEQYQPIGESVKPVVNRTVKWIK